MKNDAGTTLGDHSIGPHPLIIGKVWPTAIHCWTHDQFAQFMREHNVPVNTWADQQEYRRQAVIQALLNNTPVPQDVLAEDQELERDALMHRRASEGWTRNYDFEVRERASFEADIGYSTNFEVYESSLRQILLSMLKPEGGKRLTHGKSHMGTRFNQRELALKFIPARPPRLGTFGAFGGSPARVHIILGSSDLGPVLHSVAWDRIDQLLTNLLSEGEVTHEDVWWWLGSGWQPSSTVVDVIQSYPRPRG